MKNFKNYSVSETELYSILRTAWNNCSVFISDFQLHSPVYTEAYVLERIAAIDAAEDLPNDDVRTGRHGILRIDLETVNATCCKTFQRLERFITKAILPQAFDLNINMAGKQQYARAFRENWDSTQSMLSMMQLFVAENKTALLANENMPPTFESELAALITDFTTTYAAFVGARQTGIGTVAKINANNEVYKDGMNMLDDGKVIFSSQPEKRNMFVFVNLAEIITSSGPSTLSISVIDELTNAPLPDVNIQLQSEEGQRISGKTDANGVFNTGNIDAFLYSGDAEKTGYTAVTFTKEVNTGTDARISIVLKPLV